MRIAYWDCFSGIAGDMNLGAMVGCGLSVDDLREDLAGLALDDGFAIEHQKVYRGALVADKVDVVVEGVDGDPGRKNAHHHNAHAHTENEHHDRGLADIRADLSARTTNGSVQTDFPVTVQGTFRKNRLEGELNGGGASIELRTTNGGIRIREL